MSGLIKKVKSVRTATLSWRELEFYKISISVHFINQYQFNYKIWRLEDAELEYGHK